MAGTAFILQGRRREADGTVTEVVATFAPPVQEPDDGSWYCEVACPGVLTSEKKIYGVTAEQAVALARSLVSSQFDHYGFDPIRDS
ncbi:MAG: hypothetical protein VW405_00120 [Rhodospirillaceae bacterium]